MFAPYTRDSVQKMYDDLSLRKFSMQTELEWEVKL